MAVVRFHLESTLSPAGVMAVLTDFSPARAEDWSTIDAAHFTVHELGASWAEVTEGTGSAWERARYRWDETEGRVSVETLDSKVFGPGGGWEFRVAPEGRGTRVDVELTREPATFKRRLLASLLPLVGPSSLRKSFSGPLKAA
ncbi:hypothetical protein AB0J21_30405 [Streptomyces sp. NPDC049954]|uniref:hypothetical protein n=1 Tax=Streptomyces sp. NPDC049954 TaxID=3155779 RepID=UPI0034173BFE